MEQGRTLGGRYRLEEPIGEGGMSVVWRAMDELLGRRVAVKVLASTYEGAGANIRAEARAAARLRHPNVTNVYDYGESPEGHSPYVVMELLTGDSLADVAEAGPLPAADALRICAEVAAALAAAHSREVVHRDVKPSNVMLTPTGAKVLDFGIAAAVGDQETYDARGRILGTPAYVAPERLAGAPATPANDVYSLGLLLFRLLTGAQARPASDPFARPAPLPSTVAPPAVAKLYRACVNRDPSRRPTARAVSLALSTADVVAPAATGAGPASSDSAPVSLASLASLACSGSSASLARLGAPAGLAPAPAPGSLPVAPDLLPASDPLPTSDLSSPSSSDLVSADGLAAAGFASSGLTTAGFAPDLPPTAELPAGPRPPGLARFRAPLESASPVGSFAASARDRRSGALRATALIGVTLAVVGALMLVVLGRPAPAVPESAGRGEESLGAVTPDFVVPPPTTKPAAGAGPLTFHSVGGDVAASCTGDRARLRAWEAAKGYWVRKLDHGPARELKVEFQAGRDRVDITIRCEDGQPSAKIKA